MATLVLGKPIEVTIAPDLRNPWGIPSEARAIPTSATVEMTVEVAVHDNVLRMFDAAGCWSLPLRHYCVRCRRLLPSRGAYIRHPCRRHRRGTHPADCPVRAAYLDRPRET